MYDGGMGKDVKAIGSQYSQEGWRARRKSRGQQGLRYGARGGMHPHRRDVTYVGAPTGSLSESQSELYPGISGHLSILSLPRAHFSTVFYGNEIIRSGVGIRSDLSPQNSNRATCMLALSRLTQYDMQCTVPHPWYLLDKHIYCLESAGKRLQLRARRVPATISHNPRDTPGWVLADVQSANFEDPATVCRVKTMDGLEGGNVHYTRCKLNCLNPNTQGAIECIKA
ncbi:hypothetical protein DFH09DRAFT_1108774 [Mycena vulgaris]|nr:hypothetical protein DFH09DRAFT_1108774 [Mycena vulgaris]